jgi:hypothetical protein
MAARDTAAAYVPEGHDLTTDEPATDDTTANELVDNGGALVLSADDVVVITGDNNELRGLVARMAKALPDEEEQRPAIQPQAQADAPFDEAAARAWLEGPDPDEPPGYTVVESLGIGESFNYETHDWLSTIDSLIAKVCGRRWVPGTELLPKGTVLWLVAGGDGILDGALITRDTEQSDWNDPTPAGVRLCTHYLDWRDLTDDGNATGIDAAVAVLSAVHATASALQLPDQPKLNHSEAQELHEAIGAAIETGDLSTLSRARELAAVLVSDTLDGQDGHRHDEEGPSGFADLDSVQVAIEVDVWRDGDETLTERQWAERGWEAVRGLEAPVIAIRNPCTKEEITVDLADDEDAEE